jgi:hypothetical protein
MFDKNPDKKKMFCEKDRYFIENNMGKWPVIHLDFKSMSFSTKPRDVKFKDVRSKFIIQIIKPAFKEYDYLFFIYLARNICFKLYQTFTTENYKRLFRDYNLKDYEDVQGKIDCLLENFQEKLKGDIMTFYKYYTGRIYKREELIDALKFLMEVLYTFYEKEVIVLVDEHDTPVTSIHSAMSLNNYDENEELTESIEKFSEFICDVFKKIAKDNPHLKQFLMFGISTGILHLDNSCLNNLMIYDVLDNEYPEYFGFDEDEVNKVVDSAFQNINKKLKGIIKATAKEWYNGYCFGKNKSLHSTFSTA